MLLKNRRSTLKIHYGRTKLPALQRFFSFPVWRGRIVWLIRFILGLVRLPLFSREKLSSLMMCSIRQASALRSFWVNACGDKLLGKKAMALIDFFGNLAAHIGQMKKVIFVHCEKAAVPQGSHCMAHAWLLTPPCAGATSTERTIPSFFWRTRMVSR